MERYIKILASGEVQFIDTNDELELEELQKHVGGYIEAFRFTNTADNITFMFNEEGRLIPLERNRLLPDFFGNIIVGRTLLMEGEFRGVPISYKGVGNKDVEQVVISLKRMVESYKFSEPLYDSPPV